MKYLLSYMTMFIAMIITLVLGGGFTTVLGFRYSLIFSSFFWEQWLKTIKRLKDAPTPNSLKSKIYQNIQLNLIKIYGGSQIETAKNKKISIENFAGLKIKFLNLMAMMQEYTVLMVQEKLQLLQHCIGFYLIKGLMVQLNHSTLFL